MRTSNIRRAARVSRVTGKSSTTTTGRLILLGIFGLVVVLVGVAIASAERSDSLSRVLRRIQDTTAQIRVRAAFLLLIGFTALAESVGLETILGAFAAGALLSLLDRDEMTTHPQFRLGRGERAQSRLGGCSEACETGGRARNGVTCEGRPELGWLSIAARAI